MFNKIVILGAGLTGLGAARHLPGSVVYEAKDHVGGHVYSHRQHGVYFDEGAHICHAKDEHWKRELFANAGEVVTVPQSRVANWWHGRWVTYPVQNHLRDLPAAMRDQALAEILAAQAKPADVPPVHYDAWCRSQYGDFLTENFYREYTEKYWRTAMVEMDTDWLSGRLLPSQIERIRKGAYQPVDEKQSVFSAFHYPARGGFFAFFEKFYRSVEVATGFKVESLRLKERTILFSNGKTIGFDKLISTMPLNCLIGAMGNEVPDAIRTDAATLRHTQMLGVNIVVNKPDLAPYHWFYIYDPEIDVSRVKVLSNLIPGSLPPETTVLQTEIFRRDDEVMDHEKLKRKAVMDLGRMLGFDPDRDVRSVDHIEVSHAYTIPTLGRQAAVDRIAEWLETKGIITAGLYGKWKYVWSDQAYAAGKEAAEKVNYGMR
ncbi:MAG TPA: FAD-dependent oxidoreductase [Kiritimatiellia bacterium]|nr:FAD-dependent oxidoreductase [Kiritimatiellia bacterium]HMO98672.1 FAD-dependent oxidoreductase [Kiritimatiellia bacterium]HMP90834.1 FAD-dependent oxidoreductase [Kiritimatiellia bacterium]